MDRPSSHSQKVPYARKEGRKSLFSKMKDSMRDMLSPSWLSDLVHSVKKNSPSKDDFSPDQNMSGNSGQGTPPVPVSGFPAAQQPLVQPGSSGIPQISQDSPLKYRGSFLGNGQPRTLDFATVGTGSSVGPSPYQQGNFPPPISEFTSAQLPLTRLTEKTDSMMAQEDTMSQRSDGSRSTSGCSSMIPQTEVPRKDVPGDKRKISDTGPDGRTSPQEQQAAKRQRLNIGAANQTFSRRLSDTFVNKQSSSAASNRPAFNTSLFGSPLNNESSLLGTSFHESSFYPGKTTFGGRSSLSFRHQRKKVDLNQSLPSRLSVPVKAFMKAKPRLAPNQEAVTSSTAKRILEALDRMPTPLNDAKRIPMVPRQWTESPSFFSRDTRTTPRGPPKQKLNISAQASISRNRQVSFASVGQPKPLTSQDPSERMGMPVRQDTVLLNPELAIVSGKMRRDKSYHRGSASVKPSQEEDDTVVIPDLQTQFTLPVTSMPKFNFTVPTTAQSKPAEPVQKFGFKTETSGKSINQMPVKTASPANPGLKFSFSSPILEHLPENKPPSPEKYTGFQFSSPIHVGQKESNEVTSGVQKPPAAEAKKVDGTPFNLAPPSSKMEFNFSTAPKPKPKINGPSEPTGGGFQAASELKQGSVMDILGGGSKSVSAPSTTSGTESTQNSNATPLSTLFKSSGWTCSVCLVNNKEEVGKCLACNSPKPSSGNAAKGPTVSGAPALSTLFKPSGWNCGVCLVNNKDNVDKCAACQSAKPAGAGSQTSTAAPLSSLFKTSGWSCEVCLVNNKDGVEKCAACQTAKPGEKKSQGFSSSPLVSTIQPGNWICSSCLIQNKKDDLTCGACKTPKSSDKSSNNAADSKKSDDLFAKLKPSAGTWECEVCLVQNKLESNSCAACQTPKPLKFFKHPSGDWTCDTCLVNNKETAVNCVACNYARPGPPRTQAVPSIAKSYSMSQTKGFSFASEPSSITISSGGGFKFSAPTSSEPPKSGFDTSKSFNDSSKLGDAKSSTGGFKFDSSAFGSTSGSGFKIGTPVSSESDKSSAGGFKIGVQASENKSSTLGSGFKFGVQASSENDKSSAGVGGFKFGAPLTSESDKSGAGGGGFKFGITTKESNEKQSAGFKFGNSDSQSETTEKPLKSAGFQFGNSDSSVSNLSSSATGGKGFALGQTSESALLKDPVQATTSVPGGFTFKPSDSTTSAKSVDTVDSSKTVITTTQSVGGFNFVNSTSNSSAVSSNSIGGFQFVATKVTDSNLLSGSSKPPEYKPPAGGFNFGQKPVSNTSIPTSNFAQQPAGVTSPKRGRDEDNGEPAMKKQAPFSFGQNSSSNSTAPFQFGTNNAVTAASTTSSSLFAFGQKPASTVASSAVFNFGQQKTTPVSSVFGQASSIPVTTTVNSSPFMFGQQSNAAVKTTSSVSFPVFGQSNSVAAPTTAPAASTPSLFQFGQSSNTPAPFSFGANSTTQASGTAPVFNSTPSFNFSGQKTESSTSSSGLFKFGAQASQPTAATTPTVFGAGSTFSSNPAPAFGSGLGTTGAFSGNAQSAAPAFGATPPAFGSSKSNTGQAAPVFGVKEVVSSGSTQSVASVQTDSSSTSTDSDEKSGYVTEVDTVSSQESFFHNCWEESGYDSDENIPQHDPASLDIEESSEVKEANAEPKLIECYLVTASGMSTEVVVEKKTQLDASSGKMTVEMIAKKEASVVVTPGEITSDVAAEATQVDAAPRVITSKVVAAKATSVEESPEEISSEVVAVKRTQVGETSVKMSAELVSGKETQGGKSSVVVLEKGTQVDALPGSLTAEKCVLMKDVACQTCCMKTLICKEIGIQTDSLDVLMPATTNNKCLMIAQDRPAKCHCHETLKKDSFTCSAYVHSIDTQTDKQASDSACVCTKSKLVQSFEHFPMKECSKSFASAKSSSVKDQISHSLGSYCKSVLVLPKTGVGNHSPSCGSSFTIQSRKNNVQAETRLSLSVTQPIMICRVTMQSAWGVGHDSLQQGSTVHNNQPGGSGLLTKLDFTKPVLANPSLIMRSPGPGPDAITSTGFTWANSPLPLTMMDSNSSFGRVPENVLLPTPLCLPSFGAEINRASCTSIASLFPYGIVTTLSSSTEGMRCTNFAAHSPPLSSIDQVCTLTSASNPVFDFGRKPPVISNVTSRSSVFMFGGSRPQMNTNVSTIANTKSPVFVFGGNRPQMDTNVTSTIASTNSSLFVFGGSRPQMNINVTSTIASNNSSLFVFGGSRPQMDKNVTTTIASTNSSLFVFGGARHQMDTNETSTIASSKPSLYVFGKSRTQMDTNVTSSIASTNSSLFVFGGSRPQMDTNVTSTIASTNSSLFVFGGSRPQIDTNVTSSIASTNSSLFVFGGSRPQMNTNVTSTIASTNSSLFVFGGSRPQIDTNVTSTIANTNSSLFVFGGSRPQMDTNVTSTIASTNSSLFVFGGSRPQMDTNVTSSIASTNSSLFVFGGSRPQMDTNVTSTIASTNSSLFVFGGSRPQMDTNVTSTIASTNSSLFVFGGSRPQMDTNVTSTIASTNSFLFVFGGSRPQMDTNVTSTIASTNSSLFVFGGSRPQMDTNVISSIASTNSSLFVFGGSRPQMDTNVQLSSSPFTLEKPKNNLGMVSSLFTQTSRALCALNRKSGFVPNFLMTGKQSVNMKCESSAPVMPFRPLFPPPSDLSRKSGLFDTSPTFIPVSTEHQMETSNSFSVASTKEQGFKCFGSSNANLGSQSSGHQQMDTNAPCETSCSLVPSGYLFPGPSAQTSRNCENRSSVFAVQSRVDISATLSCFQKQDTVDDVVMEDRILAETPSTSCNHKPAEETSQRKVVFSFRPPQVAFGNNFEKKQPSPINKAMKSILKARTNEMVSAFDAATIFNSDKQDDDEDTTNIGNSLGKEVVSKAQSVSSVFGGKKSFQVTGSKSMGFGNRLSDVTETTSGSASVPSKSLTTNNQEVRQSTLVFRSSDQGTYNLPKSSPRVGFSDTVNVASVSSQGAKKTNEFISKFNFPTSSALFVFSATPAISSDSQMSNSTAGAKLPEVDRRILKKKKNNIKKRRSVVSAFSGRPMTEELVPASPSTSSEFSPSNTELRRNFSDTSTSADSDDRFNNSSQPSAAPTQTNSLFQFGAKPSESTPAAPSTGFNFSSTPAGLGSGSNFNFSAQAPAAAAFSFSATGPNTPGDGRKIKKAVRKIRR